MRQTELQTPCFIIDKCKIDCQVKEFNEALHAYWGNPIIGYSFKTNNLPWIISYMKKWGVKAEVVSSDEYQLARSLGYALNEIIFNGPVKGKKEFVEAVEGGAWVNLDNHRELEWLKECDCQKLQNSRIGLRVNFCIEEFCPGESQCGQEDGRFGFSYEQGDFFQALKKIKECNLRLKMLHLHCSSKTRSLKIYRAIAEFAVRICEQYSLDVDYIDVGGGFFGGVPGTPSFHEYFSLIHEIFNKSKRLQNVNVIVEPGICLIGVGVNYLTTVVDLKQTKNNYFAVVDGSRIHVDPFMRKKQYAYELLKNHQNTEVRDIILCGFTCMEGDRFFKLEHSSLDIGDQIYFQKVGGYTMGFASQFINFYPQVYVLENNRYTVVRKVKSAADFLLYMQ